LGRAGFYNTGPEQKFASLFKKATTFLFQANGLEMNCFWKNVTLRRKTKKMPVPRDAINARMSRHVWLVVRNYPIRRALYVMIDDGV